MVTIFVCINLVLAFGMMNATLPFHKEEQVFQDQILYSTS